MLITRAQYEILTPLDGPDILHNIESYGRVCYKSESRITVETVTVFIRNLIKRGHESVLEHMSVSVRIICDRGVSHEIVRHRIASYSQESTRFCNYRKIGVVFIKPCFLSDCPEGIFTAKKYLEYNFSNRTSCWLRCMLQCEIDYEYLISDGASPQEARSVLPNSLKTEIIVTMNLRQWRHFFKLRAAGVSGKPHPQMLEITVPMLAEFKNKIPLVFDDINPIPEE